MKRRAADQAYCDHLANLFLLQRLAPLYLGRYAGDSMVLVSAVLRVRLKRPAARRDNRPLNEVLHFADVAKPFPSRKRLLTARVAQ